MRYLLCIHKIDCGRSAIRKEKQSVKEFYDTFGWQKNEDGTYKDTSTFVDTRPVLDSYRHKTLMRVKEFLKHHGEFFLDAGSGSIPLPEYLEYSSGYKWRVCLDFSRKALKEARSKAKEQGLYVLGDVTTLPFKDDAFDSAVLLHVLYHVPEDEQKPAVTEIHRTMKPGSSCVILYSWFPIPNSLIRKLQNSAFCLKIWRKILQTPEEEEVRPLYFHAHGYKWFERNFIHLDGWDVSIRCWRSVDSILTKALVPGNFLGRSLMRLTFWLETVLPHALARIGRFPMIIIRKRD